MLRLTVSTEEYLMIGEDVKLVFLGGTGKHLRIMVDAPKDKNIVRSTVLEKYANDPEERAKLPKYYAQIEHPEKYVKKAGTAKKTDAADSTESIRKEHPAKEAAGKDTENSKLLQKKSQIIIARGNVRSGRG